MTHWAARYIGAPWDATDSHCWGFARRVWHEQFGLDVPPVNVDASSPREAMRALARGQSGWVEVADRREGDGVLMAQGQRPCHVGIWITPDPERGVLHSVAGSGVIFTQPARLVALGYRIIGTYRRTP